MKYTIKSRLLAICSAFALSALLACSDNNSTGVEEENYEGPFTINFYNQTKQTAFIVVFICEGPDTSFSYVNPGKTNSIFLQKRVTQVEFTSGLQFNVFATYKEGIKSNTSITVSQKDDGNYFVFKGHP